MQYSLWYVVPNTLPVGEPVTEERSIPRAVLHNIKLLKIGKIVARNMSS